jgi:hypothetical protein
MKAKASIGRFIAKKPTDWTSDACVRSASRAKFWLVYVDDDQLAFGEPVPELLEDSIPLPAQKQDLPFDKL